MFQDILEKILNLILNVFLLYLIYPNAEVDTMLVFDKAVEMIPESV